MNRELKTSDGPNRHLSELSSEDTIILVPGLDGTALLFYRQIPLLAQHFNVVAFPLPDDSQATMESLVDGLAQLIAEVSPDGAVLLGESFGGALCLSTALTRPELVKGLVIINSFPWLDNRLQLHAGRLAMKIIPWAAMPHIRRGTESRIQSPHTSKEDLAEFHQRMLQVGQHGYQRRLEILRSYDIRSRLVEIRPPTLLLAGNRDRLLPSERWANYMSKRIPDSELHILDGYGHVCLIDHDLDIAELVQPWWNNLKTSP